MKTTREITENIAFTIASEDRVPIHFNSTMSPEEQDRVLEFVANHNWGVKEVSIGGHPAAALPTVGAYEINVPRDVWREWRTKGVEACFRHMLGE